MLFETKIGVASTMAAAGTAVLLLMAVAPAPPAAGEPPLTARGRLLRALMLAALALSAVAQVAGAAWAIPALDAREGIESAMLVPTALLRIMAGLGGAGCLVLLLGFVTAKPRAAAPPRARAPRSFLRSVWFAGATLIMLGGVAGAAWGFTRWRERIDPEGRYVARFPDAPVEIVERTDGGTQHTVSREGHFAAPYVFVKWIEIAPDLRGLPPEKLFDVQLHGPVVANVAAGTPSQRSLTIDGRPAREVDFATRRADLRDRIRWIVDGDRAFTLWTTYSGPDADAGAAYFLESFHFLAPAQPR